MLRGSLTILYQSCSLKFLVISQPLPPSLLPRNALLIIFQEATSSRCHINWIMNNWQYCCRPHKKDGREIKQKRSYMYALKVTKLTMVHKVNSTSYCSKTIITLFDLLYNIIVILSSIRVNLIKYSCYSSQEGRWQKSNKWINSWGGSTGTGNSSCSCGSRAKSKLLAGYAYHDA